MSCTWLGCGRAGASTVVEPTKPEVVSKGEPEVASQEEPPELDAVAKGDEDPGVQDATKEKPVEEPSEGAPTTGGAHLTYLANVTAKRFDGLVPMWGCAVDVIPSLGGIRIHEDMQEQGLLVDLRLIEKSDRKCLFASQTWTSFNHPDPDGLKYNLLCELLKMFSSCSVDFPLWWEDVLFSGHAYITKEQAKEATDGGHVWFDFWSVPQRTPAMQQAYIDSIPDFVQMCSLFVVLVPPATHKDTNEIVDVRTWGGRGWCRMERMSCIASSTRVPILMVESRTAHWMASSRDWLLGPVGQGSFTCCRLNHKLPDGREIGCDKDRICGALRNLVDSRIKAAREAGDTFNHRLILSLREHLLSGLPESENPARMASAYGSRTLTSANVLDQWLYDYGFDSPLDGAGSGWTPLRYAAYEGNLDVAKRLLEAKADIEEPLKADVGTDVYLHNPGLTILHGIAMMREAPDVVKFLIDNKADVNRSNPAGGWNGAFMAAIGTNAKNFEVTIDSGCSTTARDLFGTTLLGAVGMHGCPEMLTFFKERCPAAFEELGEHEGTGLGLFITSIWHGHPNMDMLHAVRDAGADVSHQQVNGGCTLNPWKLICRGCQLKCYMKEPAHPLEMEMVASNFPGSTPLLTAAMFGHMPALTMLIELRADLLATNEYGRTALMFAAMRGQWGMCDALLAAGVPKEPKDRWGRDAAAWAEKVGDAELAEHIRRS